MGVDYSTEIGYGIAIAEDELPEALKPFLDDPYDDGGVPQWLLDSGLDKIDYTYAGDMMGGTCYFFFYAPNSYISNNPLESETFIDFAHNNIEVDVMQQLRVLAKMLDYERFDIGWKLINNVS